VRLMCGHDKEHQKKNAKQPTRRATTCPAPHTKAMVGSPQNATLHAPKVFRNVELETYLGLKRTLFDLKRTVLYFPVRICRIL